jgi:hypothetical protein
MVLTVGMEDDMVAYWVARSKVNNPDQYKKYTDVVPGILEKFGGKILEGPEKFHRFSSSSRASRRRSPATNRSSTLRRRRTAGRAAQAS